MSFNWPGEAMLRPHLQVVRGVMASILPTEQDPLIGNLKKLLIDSGSKMIRPSLVLLGAMAQMAQENKRFGQNMEKTGNEAFLFGQELGSNLDDELQSDDEYLRLGLFPLRIYRLAATVELLHTATLIHDDIIDNAKTRRGIPALHIQGEYRRAILAGDYLLSASLLLLSSHQRPLMAQQAARGIHLLCKGELLQARKQDLENISLRQYLRQIAGKTSLLFVMAVRGGAEMYSPQNKQSAIAQDLGNWAYRIGMAFQIIDDILDYKIPDKKPNLGPKTAFRDYSQGLVTLPIILALENTHNNSPLAKWCKKNPPGKNLSLGKQKHLRKLIMNDSGFTLAESWARRYLDMATKTIENSAIDDQSKALLSGLAMAMLNRTQ